MKKKPDILKALGGTALDYLKVNGKTLQERFNPFSEYGYLRNKHGLNFSANRVLTSYVSTHVDAEIAGHGKESYLNFSSQDYLGLAQNKEVMDAAREAISAYGVHTASSPILTGRNKLTEKLESTLAEKLGTEQCLLYPTGWGACFGAIAALVTKNDQVIIDSLSHNSLQTAVKYSVQCPQKFRHNDVDHLESLLKKCRLKNREGGIFVILESLYSMNSDMPDLPEILELTHIYEAILIIDIAHDFGAMGDRGLGILETVKDRKLENVILCGSFSKSFASNGGFVAGPDITRLQLVVFSPSYTFSNGISPVQCAVAQKCAEIIFSEDGDVRRKKLKENIDHAIREFTAEGFITTGRPSPIVPVLIGPEDLARLMSKEMTSKGILANMAEFPAVPKGKAIFRYQMMSTHRKEQITEAAKILAITRKDSGGLLKRLKA
jgi:7-keto-8-aminopelargonate synthetase-like enzyme